VFFYITPDVSTRVVDKTLFALHYSGPTTAPCIVPDYFVCLNPGDTTTERRCRVECRWHNKVPRVVDKTPFVS
jgi:hypothetical protein